MEKGLYKNENGNLIFAKNEIIFPNGNKINVVDYENFTTEILNGWFYFQSRNEALNFFNIVEEIEQP